MKGVNIMNMEINKNAPVKANKEIHINAPMEKVISILSNINNLINWQSSITKSELLGTIAEGIKFKWKSEGLSYNSTIHTCKKDAFGWTGTTFGAYAIHNWYFTEKNGQTFVKVEESLEGLMIKIIKKSMQIKLEKIVEQNLNDLKKESEK